MSHYSSVSLFLVQQHSPFAMRFAETISSPEKTGTRSQASSLILLCPVTAVSTIRARGCRYPILHLCHSKPTDQQSNFTQARSKEGNADVGMRIYASTKTRSYFKKARVIVMQEMREMGLRIRNSRGINFHSLFFLTFFFVTFRLL